MEIKILSLNIEGDKHLPQVIKLVKQENPDIVCLQEVFEEDFHLLHRQFNMHGIFMPTIWIDFPGVPGFNKSGPFGVVLLNKLAGEFGGDYYFKRRKPELPLYKGKPNAGNRCLVWQKTDNGLTIATTHFTWSKNGQTTEKQKRELSRLIKLLAKLKPDVLCGDFNAPRDQEIWSEISKKLTDNIPSEAKTTLDQNLHYSHGAKLVVDGFFTNPRGNLAIKSIRLIGGVSDHLAISVIMHSIQNPFDS
ncbi:endonuclease/exonuclease/phosphatase family protein [Candidatus Collierbacteria bacterium]|nr:endonuclease/exonuclease/phosphatase family protein [Candidatus Collierbacteria bacterium]